MAHPDYVCLLTACAACLGCLPKHLHEQVCGLEQSMLHLEQYAEDQDLQEENPHTF